MLSSSVRTAGRLDQRHRDPDGRSVCASCGGTSRPDLWQRRPRADCAPWPSGTSLPHPPWQNGFVERLIRSIQRESLDHIIVFQQNGTGLKSYAELFTIASENTSILEQGCTDHSPRQIRKRQITRRPRRRLQLPLRPTFKFSVHAVIPLASNTLACAISAKKLCATQRGNNSSSNFPRREYEISWRERPKLGEWRCGRETQ